MFRTIREQFLVELEHRGAADLVELNRLFQAWVEVVYHRRIHSETGRAPLERFVSAGSVRLPTPQKLKEAFLWSEHRRVAKTATVSLHGNSYEVDVALVGAAVELVFDHFELRDIDVRYQGRALGKALPHRISRHVPTLRPSKSFPQDRRPRPASTTSP